jgi:site-specific recombinase XerC
VVVRAVAGDEVARMLAGCDRRTGTGRRDFAILMVLTRLGLRRGEVAALSVDDINWHTGELVVSGKGNRRELLRLPVDVGEAIAGYCRDGRRNGGCRALFLSPWRRGTACRPLQGLQEMTVTSRTAPSNQENAWRLARIRRYEPITRGSQPC